MTRTHPARFARMLMCLSGTVVALGLGACGGDDSKQDTAPTSTPAAETPTTAPEESGGGGGGSSKGLTKPGTELAVGETAHVEFKPFSSSGGKTKSHPIDATVVKLEKGSIDDFENIDLDAKQKSSTPYYVTVRLEATDEAIPTKENDPDLQFDAIDDRMQEQGSVTFFGDFDRCVDKDAPKTLEPGDSYESCLTYLVPGGGSIEAVQWTGSDKYLSDGVVWK